MTQLKPSTARQRSPLRYWMLVLYCVGMPSFVKFDASGKTHSEGLLNLTSLSVIGMVLLFSALLVIMTLLNRQRLVQRKVNFAGWMWVALFSIYFVATLLSPPARLTVPKATDPLVALFRLYEFVLLLVLVLTVYSREEEERATDLMVRVLGATCWINIGLVWCLLPVVPSLVYGMADDVGSTHARLGGAVVNPVYLSVHAGLGFFYALFFWKGFRKYVACGLALLTLLATYARSEQLLFLITVFLYFMVVSRKTLLRWAGALSVLVVVALTATFYEKVLTYLARGQGIRNITTLSERTDVWRASMQAFWLRPWLGYGYVVGVKYALKDHWNATNWIPPHSHNEIIQALVSGGILAGALTVFLYAKVVSSAIQQRNTDPQHRFMLLALFQVVGMSFISPQVSGGHGQVGSLFVLLYTGVVGGEPYWRRMRASRQRVQPRAAPPRWTVGRAPVAAAEGLRWRESPVEPRF